VDPVAPVEPVAPVLPVAPVAPVGPIAEALEYCISLVPVLYTKKFDVPLVTEIGLT
jgi:hypothetical protein